MLFKSNKKLIFGILFTILLCSGYLTVASYMTSPEGLNYPNPGHYPGQIGPGTFNASGYSNPNWTFPGNLNVGGNICLDYCRSTWPSGGGGISCSDCNETFVNEGQKSSISSAMIKNNAITSSDIDSSSVQERVSDSCSSGSSIRVIKADGTVTCEPDDTGGGGGVPSCSNCNSDFVNEGQKNSISSAMVNFNYAGSSSEGGAANNAKSCNADGTCEVQDLDTKGKAHITGDLIVDGGGTIQLGDAPGDFTYIQQGVFGLSRSDNLPVMFVNEVGPVTIRSNEAGYRYDLGVLGKTETQDLRVSNKENCGKLYTDSEGDVLCGVDQTGGGGGVSSCSNCDRRFVKEGGDTMSGDLKVNGDLKAEDHVVTPFVIGPKLSKIGIGGLPPPGGHSSSTGAKVWGDFDVSGNTHLGDSYSSKTTVKGDLDVSRGITLGGEKRTSWPSGGVSSCSDCNSDFVEESGDTMRGKLDVDATVTAGDNDNAWIGHPFVGVYGDGKYYGGIFDNKVKVKDDLKVTGNTQLGDSSSDKTTVKGDLDVSGDIRTPGTLRLSNSMWTILSREGIAGFGSIIVGDSEWEPDFSVGGTSRFDKKVTMKGDLDVSGGITLGGEKRTSWPSGGGGGISSCSECNSDFVNKDGDKMSGDLKVSGDIRTPGTLRLSNSMWTILSREGIAGFGSIIVGDSEWEPDFSVGGTSRFDKKVTMKGDLDVSGEITTTYSSGQADINKDGYVNSLDLNLLGEVYGCQSGQSCWTSVIGVDNLGNKLYGSDLDLDGDNKVEYGDLGILGANYENYKNFRVESENDDAFVASGSGDYYSGYFTGGKGVKVEGDLDVSGDKSGYVVNIANSATTNAFGLSADVPSIAIRGMGSQGVVGVGDTFWGVRGEGTGGALGILGISDTGYSGYFTGGKGVKIEGDLDVSGKITKTDYVKGDCDKNGIVNMDDADCIMNYVVGNNNNCDDVDCDINDDGDVRAGDPTFLAQILVGTSGYNARDVLPYDSIASITPYAKFTAFHKSDALTADASGSNAYSGHFIGGEGVKVNGDLEVTGSKNAVINTSQGKRKMAAVEAPTTNFVTSNSSQLINGEREVKIEPLFLETINTDSGYQVLLTPTGNCQLYVSDKKEDRFVVKSSSGKTNCTFDWFLYGKRKGYENQYMEKEE